MEMNINEVKNFLPHRYPFLLIDRVISFESGKNLTAIKMSLLMSHNSQVISQTNQSCLVF